MMGMPVVFGKPVFPVDAILYTLAVLLGLAIVGMNYLSLTHPRALPEPYPASAEIV